MKFQRACWIISICAIASIIGLAGCYEPPRSVKKDNKSTVDKQEKDSGEIKSASDKQPKSDDKTPSKITDDVITDKPTDVKQPADDNNKPVDVKTDDKPAAKPTADPTEPTAKPNPAKSIKVLLGSPELTAGIPGAGELKIDEIKAWLDDPANHEILDVDLPLGLSLGKGQITGLDKNPLTRAKIELGRQLYFDERLSYDQTVSCASCHDPSEGYSRHTKTGIGIKKQAGGRNSPISYNRILSGPQFWDGRAASLEDQAVGPIANPIEMGNSHEACVKCLQEIEGYRLEFEKVFGELSINTVGKAIASFERTLVTGPSPFDYYERIRPFVLDPSKVEELEDDDAALARYKTWVAEAEAHPMNESARRGRELFFTEKANCTACHVGANLADEKYHNLGVGMDAEKPDVGRFEVTKDEKDTGAFKTPTIRNVALSAPYMHDGSQQTLEEVVEWYAKGGHPNKHLSDKIKKLTLTDQDKKDLVEFMKACTGEFPKVERGRLPEKIK